MDATKREARQSALVPISGWPNYAATMDGQVWSLSNWRGWGVRALTAFPDTDGYPQVRLSLGGGARKPVKVHRLIALAFLGPCPAGCDQVRHLNGDKTDNRAQNLAWGSAADNAADRAQHGRTSSGPRHSQAIRAGLVNSPHPSHRKLVEAARG